MRIGIIGGGQLGQMLGYAGRELGFDCVFIDPAATPPASDAGKIISAAFDDVDAITALAETVDVLTYEFENVPVAALEPAAAKCPVYPPLDALSAAQDRLSEKRLFESLDIPLPGWHQVDTRKDLDDAAAKLGLPVVLKTRRLGYDGKGQFVIKSENDIATAWDALGGSELIAEEWVAFDYEVSQIATRGVDDDIEFFPLTHNQHAGGILRYSRAPVVVPALGEAARDAVRKLMESLDYVGTVALELFVRDGGLLANEFAPRVHNSGHWTIEGAETSQFANHLLAVAGHKPRPAPPVAHAGMLNLIGTIPASAREVVNEGTVLHDYGKSPREGRKLGHITITANTPESRDAELIRVGETVTGSTPRFETLE